MSEPRPDALHAEQHRRLAAAYFNEVWDLLEHPDRTADLDDRMVHLAHASRLHWELAGGGPERLARGEWQLSRVYSALGRGEPALHHASRSLELCEANGIADFDLAFAHEAMARAHAVAGHVEDARHHAALASEAAMQVSEDEDRAVVDAALDTLPVR